MIFIIFTGFVSSLSFSSTFINGSGIYLTQINHEPFNSSPYFYRISIRTVIKEVPVNLGILCEKEDKSNIPAVFLSLKRSFKGVPVTLDLVLPSGFFTNKFMASYFLLAHIALCLHLEKNFLKGFSVGINTGIGYAMYKVTHDIVEEQKWKSNFEGMGSIYSTMKLLKIKKRDVIFYQSFNIFTPFLFFFGICIH